MVVGAGLSLLGATSDFLFVSGVLFYPFGIMANLYFVALTAVAMLKYQLLELRVVLCSGLTYTLLGIFIVGVYGVVFVLFNFTFRSQSESARLLSVISAAAVVAIALQPVLNQLQHWADRWFYRERYDHLQALEQFSHDTKDITDLTSISDSLTGLVRRAMLANSASLLLPAPQTSEFYVASASGLKDVEDLTLRDSSPILSWLREHDDILTRQDLEVVARFRALTVADMRTVAGLDTELLIPLKTKGELTGVLVVGPKLSDEDYSNSDINLMQAVVNQTATAIENARLYAQEAERLVELEELEKLKQTLLLTVAHELKTPLTAIKAGTEMLGLQEEAPATSAKGRLIRSINRGVERLERLVDESLDYARMQDANLELELQPTDLKELYEETVNLLMPAARAKRQTLELNLPEHIPTICVDRRRCERILLNLISNANRYTPPGGSITVHVKVEPNCVVTSVTDNGQGVPEGDLDKIFNVYYRNSSADGRGAGQSSGIGLAIAKYLAELHGGKIWAESKVGEGSTFYFTIPLGDEMSF
jgi:signal transduction histidine kinase